MTDMQSDTAVSTLPTRSGLTITVRPATEADEDALAALFDGVTAEDRRFRFFSAIDHISHERLDPLIHADHHQTESYVAFDASTGQMIASALLAADKAMDTGEIAVSIHADYKGRGVGWALLDFLGQEAQRRGLRRVIAIESRDNHAAIELEREKGFTPSAFDGDPSLVILTKTFAPA